MKTATHFSTQVHGKWILCGEHAVLRGHPALVFPVPNKQLSLHYQSTGQPLSIRCTGSYAKPLALLFHGLLQESLSKFQHNINDIKGDFLLDNHIPIGAGLGFSAALCIALARWLCWQGWIQQDALFAIAHNLESYFHGNSSGIDIAGALFNQPLFYQEEHYTPLTLAWKPQLYLSYTELPSVTAECITAVNTLIATNRQEADRLDHAMAHSTKQAQQALASPPSIASQELLAKALHTAYDCFTAWQLVPNNLQQKINHLTAAGAIAVKPTGAGKGGHLISLWSCPPPSSLSTQLFPAI